MAIQFSSKAPQDGHQRIQSHLSTSQAAISKGITELRGRSGIAVSEAIQIWTVDLNNSGNHLHEVAKSGEWQYLIFEGEEAIAGAHLSDNADRNDVTAVNYGPLTKAIVDGIQTAENLPEAQEHHFEPRLLIIPSLPFTGLWLHNLSAENRDLVIPIPPSTLSLEQMSTVSLSELEAELKKAADDVRKQIEAKPGESGGSGNTNSTNAKASGFIGKMSLQSLNLESTGSNLSGGAAAVTLPQFMQPQQQTNWCWAAVGTSVGLFYNTGKWTQCDTATGCLPGEDCCKAPAPCNVYGYLNESLSYTKSYDRYQSGTISVNTIKNELQAGNPVGTRVAWYGGGAHFMTITGVSGNDITIQDPIFGTTTMAYSNYASRYQSGGTWTGTYFCKPN